MKLTIYHNGQFWVGVIEECVDSKLTAMRFVFGTEPHDADVLDFLDMIKKHQFKLLPDRDTSALMIKTILVIIGAANLNKQFKNGGSISKTFEQKELSTMNQQEELIYQESAEGTHSHVHEFEGSVMLAEEGDDRHNHRFAGVTSQVIPDPGWP